MESRGGSEPRSRFRWLAAIPWKLMLVVIAASLAVREFYPLSWFPMFTNLDRNTWYVFLTDGEDRKIAVLDEFGWTGDRLDNHVKRSLATIRKFEPELEDDAALERAALATLRHLLAETPRARRAATADRVLELWRADVRVAKGRLVREESELARLTRAEAITMLRGAEAPASEPPDEAPDDG